METKFLPVCLQSSTHIDWALNTPSILLCAHQHPILGSNCDQSAVIRIENQCVQLFIVLQPKYQEVEMCMQQSRSVRGRDQCDTLQLL